MKSIQLRTAKREDRAEIAELIYASTNAWYQLRGMPRIFSGGPETTEVFCEVYDALEPGCCVVAENPRTGRLMGSYFYHPRPQHVSLGIMNVHPNYFGRSVARALLDYIIDYTNRHGYKALRLTQSALNLDSFSLYNSAGFVPRYAYQDMMLSGPGRRPEHEPPWLGIRPGRDARRRACPGRSGAVGQRHQPRGRLPFLHRERAGILARLGLRSLGRQDRGFPDLFRPSSLQHAWPGRCRHGSAGSGFDLQGTRSLPGAIAGHTGTHGENGTCETNVRVGREERRAALLPGARRVPAICGRQSAHLLARDLVKATTEP